MVSFRAGVGSTGADEEIGIGRGRRNHVKPNMAININSRAILEKVKTFMFMRRMFLMRG